jgi:hypothetical protein
LAVRRLEPTQKVMIEKVTTRELLAEARKSVSSFAIFRIESAVIIALTVLLTGAALMDIGVPRQWWWAVPLFGIAAELLIIYTTLHDKNFLAQISARMFYERLNPDSIKTPELRASLAKGLEFHQDIFKAIKARPNAPLGPIAQNMDEWVTRIFAVTRGLDTFVNDPDVVARLTRMADEANAEVVTANDEPISANNALSVIMKPIAGTDDSDLHPRRGLLEDVRAVVNNATQELDGSLRGMGMIQHQLRTTNPVDLDWHMTQRLSIMIGDHLNGLERADELIESLFQNYHNQPDKSHELIDAETIDTVQSE